MTSLKKLRKHIDQVDQSLLDLLTRRARLVKDVGSIKEKNGQSIFAPDRERALLADLKSKNPGPLSDEAVENLFLEVVHACRHLQKKLTVAYFGPEASYTHAAAIRSFGRSAELAPMRTISEVFAEVDKGRADFGVVPIENSTGGGVYHTLDMFIDSPLSICAELELPVHHYLLSRTKSGARSRTLDLGRIKVLFSHYQALSQCRNWVDAHLPNAKVVESTSTSEAAQQAARIPGSAAIASHLAAEQYGLGVLAARIEDSSQNYTRFLVIGTTEPHRTGHDKTSILFSIKDRAGALFDMLLPFKKQRLNLTKIESRPTRQRAWEYIFFVDFLGHRSEPRVQKALAQLERTCVFLKILGSYPRSE
jgi:chorismate mutase/prephenate dehydratase